MTKLIAFFTALFTLIGNLFAPIGNLFNCSDTEYVYKIDATADGGTVPNFASNINVWEMGRSFLNVPENRENDIFEFVEYVQLMNCTGGTVSRDLFDDPLDTTVRDDYNFTNLINNCKGILKLGAKPCLITGNVPLKLTTDPEKSVFSDNANPPDDWDEYYDYIYAMAEALVNAFGKDELLTWHYGVMTEYENGDWFVAKSGKAKDTAVAYCKMYDYTVAALQAAIGNDIYIGAHSMTVTEGLWDEAIFIKHVAREKNYKTGEKGTRICYLSASFYDSTPEQATSGKTLYETIMYLKRTAEFYGLKDLDYGIDEGRILSGLTSGTDSVDLLSRSTGYTIQAAYDARGYAALWDAGADYFSYWDYLSGGIFTGNPTVSYYVSKLIAGYKGMTKATVKTNSINLKKMSDVDCRAAYDKDSGTVKFFAYNYKADLDYRKTVDMQFNIKTTLPDGNATVTVYRINDDCNWFDEWCEDRITYGITDDCFSWSPDDGCVNMLRDARAKEIYNSLFDKYTSLSVLNSETYEVTVKDGKIVWGTTIEPNTAVFFEIGR